MLVHARRKECLGCKELRAGLLCSLDTANRGVLGCKTDKCICEGDSTQGVCRIVRQRACVGYKEFRVSTSVVQRGVDVEVFVYMLKTRPDLESGKASLDASLSLRHDMGRWAQIKLMRNRHIAADGGCCLNFFLTQQHISTSKSIHLENLQPRIPGHYICSHGTKGCLVFSIW